MIKLTESHVMNGIVLRFKMLAYPAKITPDGDGFMVSFRDVPEALTGAKTSEEAIDLAHDALLTAIDFYFEDRRIVPAPSDPVDDEVMISLPASLAAKILLLNEMVRERVTPAELARKIHVTPQTVNRLIDPRHSTKIDTIESALRSIGSNLRLSVVPASHARQ